MSKRIAAVALATCVLVAGCGGPFSGETTAGTTGDVTADSTTDSAQVIAAPPSNETTAASRATTTAGTGDDLTSGDVTSSDATSGDATSDDETPDGETTPGTTGTATTRETVATYDSDIGYELRVSSARETPQRVTVRIEAVNDSAVAFADSVLIVPNASREFEFGFPHAGTYEASVEVGDASVTRRWEVASRNPDDALSVHVAPDGEVYLGFVGI